MREAASKVVAIALLISLPILIAFAVFIGPVSLVAETVELVNSTATDSATIQLVEVTRGGKGATRVAAKYVFVADGTEHQGSRVSVGFGDWGYSTGRAALARELTVGAKHPVYFNPHDPENAVLFYGWNKGTILINAFCALAVLRVVVRYRPLMRAFVCQFERLAVIAIVALLLFGPPVLPPLPVVLVGAALFFAAFLVEYFLPASWLRSWSSFRMG